MPHAELCGKLSSTGSNATSRLEDLLTSDVFGRLRYLQPEMGLLPVLQRSVNLRGEYLSVPPPHGLPDYKFWPRFQQTEPDVLIQWTAVGGRSVNVVVECKHLSGKSGSYSPAEQDQQLELASASADQLVREYTSAKGKLGSVVLLYVTGHRRPPLEDLHDSLTAAVRSSVDRKEFEGNLYWVGWPQVWDALRAFTSSPSLTTRDALILADVVALLAHKGYRSFMKVDPPALSLPAISGPMWYVHQRRA